MQTTIERQEAALMPPPTEENIKQIISDSEQGENKLEDKNFEMITQKDGKLKKIYAPRGLSVKMLAQIEFPRRVWLAEGFIPPGVTVIIADYKSGKTLFAYQFSIAVATGGTFLGWQVSKGTVVYFDLESNFERAQERLIRMGADMDDLEKFVIVTNGIEMLRSGLEEQLIAYKQRYPDLRLVVIDTLSKVYPSIGEKGMFMEETKLYGDLRRQAQQMGITVIIIHHKTKMDSGSGINPLSLGYGTNALPANADVIIGLYRRHTTDSEVHLLAQGNDIENLDLICEYKDLKWTVMGNSEEIANRRQEEEILSTSQFKAIASVWRNHKGNTISFRPSDLIEEAQHWPDIGWIGEAKGFAKWIRENKFLIERTLGVEVAEKRNNAGQQFFLSRIGQINEKPDT